jgi:hypothetical protein
MYYIKAQILSWFGHLHRVPEERMVKKVYKWKLMVTHRPVLLTHISVHVFVLICWASVLRNSRLLLISWQWNCAVGLTHFMYRGADKSLARPTSQFILFDGENISFDASLVIYTNSTNIPPIMIINRIYEHQNLLSL